MGGALGLLGAAVGDRVDVAIPGASPVSGEVDWVAAGRHHDGVVLRIDRPAPGTALIFVNSWREAVYTNVHAHLFGAEAAAVAAREGPAWRAWMAERFPAAAVPSA
jgi:hypothetical protein